MQSAPPTKAPTNGDHPEFPVNWKKKKLPAHLKPAKYSSTSSLYIDSTITKPKNAELVLCMAEYFTKNLKPADQATPEQKKAFDVFDETLHPIITKNVDLKPPTVEVIEKYIKSIFKVGQLAPESLIMGVAYIERITLNFGFVIYPFNWRRIILATLMLASKVWEDQAVWNVDFLELFPLATTQDLGQLEKRTLSLLNFDVSLKASDYATIYFNLRSQSSAMGEHFNELQPLDKDAQEKLEVRTSNFSITPLELQNSAKKLVRSSGSVDDITQKIKSPRAVIN